jgi:transposase
MLMVLEFSATMSSMFVRIKSSPNSPKKFVQIVESIRKGQKVSQKIVRHIGYALNDDELEKLKMLAESLKIELEAGDQKLIFSPEQLASIKKKRIQADSVKSYDSKFDVNLKDLLEEQRTISGIHDVYGTLFDNLRYANIFKNPARQKANVEMFKNIVLARIANPASKMASVDMLEKDFGIRLDLQRVYRMMDKIDDEAIKNLNQIAYTNTADLFNQKIDVVFFDATTLYFESFTCDEFKDTGFSKDLKFNQPQVLFAIMVNKEGLPIGYKVFPGNTYEGHTVIPMLKQIRQERCLDKVIWVADSGMMNAENLKELEEEGFEYIIGARLKNMSKNIKQSILKTDDYKGDDDYKMIRIPYKENKNLVVSYKASRARKDALDREKAIDRLQKKIAKQKNPKDYLSNYGHKKYLKVSGDSRIEIDEDKVKEACQWDGFHGVITNAKDLSDKEILAQYTNLWHVEEAFRISKHDLKVRPIFHWTASRIKAHMAICFTAYALVKNLEYRVRLQYKALSIEKIRAALVRVQTSILFHTKKNVRFAMPSSISDEARKIYKLMNLSRCLTPWIVNAENVVPIKK